MVRLRAELAGIFSFLKPGGGLEQVPRIADKRDMGFLVPMGTKASSPVRKVRSEKQVKEKECRVLAVEVPTAVWGQKQMSRHVKNTYSPRAFARHRDHSWRFEGITLYPGACP